VARRADISNPRLTPEELIKGNKALDLVHSRTDEFSGGDSSLRFAYDR